MKPPVTTAIAFAAATVYAQIDVLTGALSNVSSSVEALDKATTNFNIDAIKTNADTLISTIAAGKDAVNASQVISLVDSLGLNGPVLLQNKDFETLAADLKTKRPDIEKANACRDVHSRIATINTGSLGLTEAIIAKVPQAAQPIVRQVAAGASRVLNQAQFDFSEDNCNDSSPTVSPTPSPTASSSADSKQTPVGGIVGGVLGGVGAMAVIGLSVYLFLRRRRQQRLKQEREPPVELDANDGPPPLLKEYKEECAKAELGGQETERGEMCADSTAIHEAPENARYELE